MTTLILVGLIVVLLAAAAYVGVLLLRRSRSARTESGAASGTERPRTVADLVRKRVEPAGDVESDPEAEMSGDELFVPAVPRQDGVAVPAAPGGPAAPAPSPQPATPAGGLEVGDAPWRRAARMTGAEPGGAWETAPLPVVAATAPTGAHRVDGTADAATSAAAAPSVDEPAASLPEKEPALVPSAVPGTDPALAVPPGDPAPAQLPADGKPADLPEAVVERAPETVSRPLSDPDLTPLMGIPIIRSATVETAVPGTAVPGTAVPGTAVPGTAVPETVVAGSGALDRPAPDAPAGPAGDAIPPVPRTVATSAPDDDDVVLLLPSTSAFPVVAPPATGSPQPVWFRVVRRDGEPVPAAVVTLLDDHGREVDATKTAGDGGGELCTPHGGRFLMIVSADGHQPRAAMITVDGEPVELALLLPRSATVSGSVHAGSGAVRDARVVVRRDHDVVDEARSAGDGHYRFDDLAEGTYTVAATAAPGAAVARVSLAEGADVHVDLHLRGN